jgi:hypothetical protein
MTVCRSLPITIVDYAFRIKVTMRTLNRYSNLRALVLLLFFVTGSGATEECKTTTNEAGECMADCQDFDEAHCKQWASVGKCSKEFEENNEFYLETCPKACRTCWSCDDESDSCKGAFYVVIFFSGRV